MTNNLREEEMKEYLKSKLYDGQFKEDVKHGSIILNNNHAVNLYPNDYIFVHDTHLILHENNNKEDKYEHYIPYSSILKIRFRGKGDEI